MALNIDQLDAIVFDFDGVLTDNTVWVSETGQEAVRCHRGDGLAFDAFKRLPLKIMILSTETNRVVQQRAKKLSTPCVQGSGDKLQDLQKLANESSFRLERTLFIGNDLNDLRVMQAVGFSACPQDSHPRILEISSFILDSKGGEGVAREVLEKLLQVDILDVIS